MTPIRAVGGAVLFFAAMLAVGNVVLVSQRPPAFWLRASEVTADARRLNQLASRTRVTAASADACLQLTYTLGNRCGAPLGMALLTPFGRDNRAVGPEAQLWFRLATFRSPPRNPADTPAGEVLLARATTSSDLVWGEDPRRLEIEVREEIGAEGPPRLRLDNLGGRWQRPADSALAPELAAWVEPAHCSISPLDVAVLASLARSLRARVCDDLDVSPTRCYDTVLILYRDQGKDRYRLDLSLRNGPPGRLALLLRTSVDPSGVPVRLTYRILRISDLAKPANLFFTRPVGAGEPLTAGGAGFHGLRYEPPLAEKDLADVELDLRALFDGTPWLRSQR